MNAKQFLPCLLIGGVLLRVGYANAATITYTHDSFNRLTNAAHSDGSRESYSYDSAGNRLTRITGVFDNIAPSTPAGLVASTNSNGEISLTWNQSQDLGVGVAGYSLYLNSVFYTNVTTTNIVLAGLYPNTAYCITLAAYDRASNISPQSSLVCLVTPEMNLSGNPGAKIFIYSAAGPRDATSPSFNTYATNVINYLKTGIGLSFERTAPMNFVVLDTFSAGDIMASRSNTFLWRGQFNPASPFANEVGTRIRFPVKIVSDIPFNLNGVFDQLSSSDSANAMAFAGALTNLNYGFTRIGLWYGIDGIKDTTDDVWRTSGAGSALINELFFTGVSSAFNCDSLSDIATITNYLASNSPFAIKCRYSVYDTNGRPLATALRTISTVSQLPSKIILLSCPNGILNFGSVQIGSTTNMTLTISNAGVSSLSVAGVGCPYGFSSSWTGGTLLPGDSTNVTITFRPNLLVSYGGVVSIYSDATAGNDVSPVFGSAIGDQSSSLASITIHPTPGPNTTSPSFIPWRNNLIRFLETGVGGSHDRLVPTNVTFPNMVDVGDILVSTNPVSLWRGQLNPQQPFENENGNWVYFAVKIVSANPFNLNGVSWNQKDMPARLTPYVGQMTNFSYSASVVGVSYGSDGIKGTVDDVRIVSGSSTQLVNELYYRGVASSFYGNSQTQIQNTRNIIASLSPYYHLCTWAITGTNGSQLATATSSILVLLSLPASPPTLANFGFQQTGKFSLQILGTPGLTYEIWSSTNLENWEYLTNVSAFNTPVPWIDTDTSLYSQRFYRLQTGTNSIYLP